MNEQMNQPQMGGIPTPPSQKQNTGMAIISYFGVLFIIPLLTDAKNDPFVKYHIKQGMSLFIIEVAWWIINSFIFGFLPLGIFLLISGITWIVYIFFFVLFIMGIMNASKGVQKPLPIIGGIADKLNF